MSDQAPDLFEYRLGYYFRGRTLILDDPIAVAEDDIRAAVDRAQEERRRLGLPPYTHVAILFEIDP